MINLKNTIEEANECLKNWMRVVFLDDIVSVYVDNIVFVNL